ncbi:hypothetical protein MSAN_01347500 [Mycena sanguinolenta]|uniref:Uncharacterized protein n=1 Tax=Mycena sanguinolenta TaxID=230812 RepID=A0A8H6YE68_9AGAR|nr:hypothetical protein MSAN_01347500 [Mycena sanguinolenta]
MPAPAVAAMYVLAAVGTVAAGLAFKEFVYEPHIAPRVERWAEEFLAKRQARRMQRSAVAVPSTTGGGGASDMDGRDVDGKSTYELESLVADEVRQWRSQVDVTRGEGTSGLRHRKHGGGAPSTASTLDESNILIPYDTLAPTHILFDPADGLDFTTSSSPTSTSTISSRVATPSVHSSLSHSTFFTPPVVQAPPTPEPSVRDPTPTPSPTDMPAPSQSQSRSQEQEHEQDPFLFSVSSPHHVPSLSLSHPLDLEHDLDRDVELLSAPSESSSRPSSPFSDFSHSGSQPSGHEQFYSFHTFSDAGAGVRSASENGSDAGGDDIERWSNVGSEASNVGSEVSGSSWASAGGAEPLSFVVASVFIRRIHIHAFLPSFHLLLLLWYTSASISSSIGFWLYYLLPQRSTTRN